MIMLSFRFLSEGRGWKGVINSHLQGPFTDFFYLVRSRVGRKKERLAGWRTCSSGFETLQVGGGGRGGGA